jgi:hypothetical protein
MQNKEIKPDLWKIMLPTHPLIKRPQYIHDLLNKVISSRVSLPTPIFTYHAPRTPNHHHPLGLGALADPAVIPADPHDIPDLWYLPDR